MKEVPLRVSWKSLEPSLLNSRFLKEASEIECLWFHPGPAELDIISSKNNPS